MCKMRKFPTWPSPSFTLQSLLSALGIVACPPSGIQVFGIFNDDGGPGPFSAVAHFSWGKDHGGVSKCK